jgi:hypothetical protein
LEQFASRCLSIEAMNHNKCGLLPAPFRWSTPSNDDEAVAEAIRFFVAEQMKSGWKPTRHLQKLNAWSYDFERLRAVVRGLVSVGRLASVCSRRGEILESPWYPRVSDRHK